MSFAAIPTIYKDVQFRSRLEARWAAFFDLCGWSWIYEPLNLDGWIPDFLINGHKHIYVEIKPTHWTRDAQGYPKMDLAAYSKVAASAIGNDILLLGVGPTKMDGTLYLGYCNEPEVGVEDLSLEFDPAISQETKLKGAAFGYCHSYQSFQDRISGFHPGGSAGGFADLGERLWNKAGNSTQWKAIK